MAETVQTVWAAMDVPSAATASRARSCRRWRCLTETPRPTDKDIDAAMTGNLCRCATYQRIRGAIHKSARLLEA